MPACSRRRRSAGQTGRQAGGRAEGIRRARAGARQAQTGARQAGQQARRGCETRLQVSGGHQVAAIQGLAQLQQLGAHSLADLTCGRVAAAAAAREEGRHPSGRHGLPLPRWLVDACGAPSHHPPHTPLGAGPAGARAAAPPRSLSRPPLPQPDARPPLQPAPAAPARRTPTAPPPHPCSSSRTAPPACGCCPPPPASCRGGPPPPSHTSAQQAGRGGAGRGGRWVGGWVAGVRRQPGVPAWRRALHLPMCWRRRIPAWHAIDIMKSHAAAATGARVRAPGRGRWRAGAAGAAAASRSWAARLTL